MASLKTRKVHITRSFDPAENGSVRAFDSIT
jgi:hypothetical protein